MWEKRNMFSKTRIPPNSSMEADVPKSFTFQIIGAEKRFWRGAKATCCAHLFYLIPMFFEDMLSAKKNSLGNNVLSRNQDFFLGGCFFKCTVFRKPYHDHLVKLPSPRVGSPLVFLFTYVYLQHVRKRDRRVQRLNIQQGLVMLLQFCCVKEQNMLNEEKTDQAEQDRTGKSLIYILS